MLINISASGDSDGWQVKPRYKMQEVPEKGFLSESDTDEEPLIKASKGPVPTSLVRSFFHSEATAVGDDSPTSDDSDMDDLISERRGFIFALESAKVRDAGSQHLY